MQPSEILSEIYSGKKVRVTIPPSPTELTSFKQRISNAKKREAIALKALGMQTILGTLNFELDTETTPDYYYLTISLKEPPKFEFQILG